MQVCSSSKCSRVNVRLFLLVFSSLLGLSCAAVLSLKLGELPLQLSQLFDALSNRADSRTRFVVLELRMPRLITAILAGAALGLAGSLMQALTRNPLASPGIMGITPSVSLGVVIGIVAFNLSQTGMLLAGMASGMGCGLLLFLLSHRQKLQPLHLTLTGVSISLFATAAILTLLVTASAEANGLYFWLTGSLINRTWQHADHLLLYIPLTLLLSLLCFKPLNLMRLSDDHCQALGLKLQQWRVLTALIVVLLISATVTVTGPIGFVGLVSPHLVRLSLKKPFGALDYKLLLPLSTLVGASLLTVADTFSRLNEIPVGILVACVGAPIFLYLIREEAQHYVR